MRAREYLGQIKEWDGTIERLEAQAEIYRRQAVSVSPRLDGVKGSKCSGAQDYTGDAVAKYLDKVQDLTSAVEVVTELRDEIINTINKLNNSTYRTVLFKRYVEKKSWRRIAREMTYSEGHVYRLHRNALKALDNVLKRG